MNALAARKRLLIARADQLRESMAEDRQRMVSRVGVAHDFVQRYRWWLLGGAIVGGVLIASRWRKVLAWLPVVADLCRAWLR